jgi:hypothetical protein
MGHLETGCRRSEINTNHHLSSIVETIIADRVQELPVEVIREMNMLNHIVDASMTKEKPVKPPFGVEPFRSPVTPFIPKVGIDSGHE